MLRINAGLGKLGSEYSDQYNPLEAGLLHLTSFTKGCYLGQEVVARLDSYNKVKQRVMGFVGTSDVVPGDTVLNEEDVIGKITSVVHYPETNEVRALGYIRMEHAHPGSNVTIGHEGNKITMELRLLPMVN
jgi:folate-binding protein YgfZ